jgi:hypothetical protein
VIFAPVALVVEAIGGTPPYAFDLASGALPPGIAIAADGRIAGTPTTPGSYPFTVRVRDALGAQAEQPYVLDVTKIPTRLRAAISPNPAVSGQEVVINASAESSVGPPTGTLDAWAAGPGTRCPDPFEGGSAPVTPNVRSATLTGGSAQIVFPDLSIGAFRVCVRYGGTATLAESTFGPVDLFVIKGILLPSPKLTLTAPGQVSAGSQVDGRVVIEAVGTAARPTGSVRLRDGARYLGEFALVDGAADFSVVARTAPGLMTLAASYPGDGAFSSAASGLVVVTVSKAEAVASPSAIPALDAPAAALLGLLLAALAVARLRRR